MPKKPARTLFLLLFCLPFSLPAQQELPINLSGGLFLPLRTQTDATLQQNLLRELSKRPGRAALIADKKLAVGLVDLRDPHKIRFAAVNGNEMLYAASLPKIAILLAVVDAMEKGEVKETPQILSDLNAMIRYSDNHASTRMIDLVGYEKIEEVLTNPRYDLFDAEYGGGLWVGKRYAASGARHPDPIKGLSHAATVSQVCRFYYMLAMGQLVSRSRSRQMLDILNDPGLHHKFVHSLDQIAPQAELYRKSGSWRTYHSDSVLVWDKKNPRRRYILVALTDSPDGEQIIRDLVNIAERVLRIP